MEKNKCLTAYYKAYFKILHDPKSALYASTLLTCPVVASKQFELVATNGINTFINPDNYVNLSPNDQVAILKMAAFHVAAKHPLRSVGKDKRIFNMASHTALSNTFYLEGIYASNSRPNKDFKNWATEQIYYHLLKEKPPKEELATDTVQILNFAENVEDAINLDGSKLANQTSTEMSNLESLCTTTFNTFQKSIGEIAGDTTYQTKIEAQHIQWKKLLRQAVQGTSKAYYSYQRCRRTYLPDIYLPSILRKGVGELHIGIDTSASMPNEILDLINTEVGYIKHKYTPKCINISTFDTEIQQQLRIKKYEKFISLSMQGRGGTDATPILEYYSNIKYKDELFIFTDYELYDRHFTKPKYAITWIIYNNPKAKPKFGKAIHITI